MSYSISSPSLDSSSRVGSNRVVSFAVDPAAPAHLRAVWLAITVLAATFLAPIAHGRQINVDAQDAEVLTRGAIHDAFAIPVGLDPVAGPIVPREPPADIEELPPEVAVEDPNAEWIPGYWTWDEERDDFIWTSGVWRVAPPNHRWVAGYWTPVTTDTGAQGFQRISGFWAPNETRQVVYYPQPPASLEAGPNVPQPSPDYFWVPGNWVYTDGRYVWRGGYWAASQQNWVWMPSYYVRTPGGYIYNAGYWDYPLDNRGMMFAPVYFTNRVYTQPGFRYSPSVLIRATQLLVHLFVQPNYGRYYFGDYYGPSYATAGYYPWFAAGAPRGGNRWYDPIYVYQRSHHRGDPNWSRQWQQQHDFYAQHQEARPRRTYNDQRRFDAEQGPNRDRNEFRNAILATSVADVVNNNVVNKDVLKNITNVNIRRVQNDERTTIEKRSQDFKQFAKQRSQVERESRVAGNDGRGPNNVGPRPGAGPGAGPNRPQQGAVAAGPVGATLTLPEVKNPTRVNVGFGPRGSENRDPTADAGPPNQPGANPRGPNRPDGADRPDRPNQPDRGPNPNRPDADNPQTGRPTPMPGGPGPGRNTGIVPPRMETPRTDTPRNEPPRENPNPTPKPSATPGVPRLPQVPVGPGTGELPRAPRGNQPGGPNVPGRADPSLPGATPMPTPKLPDQPRNPRFNQPRNDQPRTEQPRNEQPRMPQGNRPNFGRPGGVNVPGPTREQPMPKPETRQGPKPNDRPPQAERSQQRERPQPKADAPQVGPKPDRGPPPSKPDDDKPKGTKPEKKDKK